MGTHSNVGGRQSGWGPPDRSPRGGGGNVSHYFVATPRERGVVAMGEAHSDHYVGPFRERHILQSDA